MNISIILNRVPMGYRYFWAMNVTGGNFDKHCLPCFRGTRLKEFKNNMAPLTYRVSAAPGSYVYICGVGWDFNPVDESTYDANFHLALRPNPGARASATGNRGLSLDVVDAEIVPIPALPPGWNGKHMVYTMCRNYQFIVEYFGKGQLPPSKQLNLL